MNKKIKLAAVVAAAVGALALISVLIYGAVRHKLIQDNEALVHSVAQSILPALLINDSTQVQVLMKALGSYPGIQSAELINADGAPIATYARADRHIDPMSPTFELASVGDDPNQVHVMAPITFDSLIVANLHIAVNLWPTYIRIMSWLGVLLIVPSVIYVLIKQFRLKLRFERVSSGVGGGPTWPKDQEFDLNHAVKDAMIDADISIEFQPIKRMSDGGVFGMEVVVCWRHPSGQTLYVSPANFVALAAKSGIFLPFDDWLLSTACAHAAEWQHRYGPLVLMLNITADQLNDATFAKKIRTICEKTQYPHQLLELQIAEAALSHNTQEVCAAIQSLTKEGLGVTLDSFGLSNDSLALLETLPIRKIKLHSRMMKRVGHDDAVMQWVHSMISHSLTKNVQVMVDGIDSQSQFDALKSMGCSLGQGSYINPPLSASKFSAFLSSSKFGMSILGSTGPIKGFSVV
jgi:EAL domain-containing protein (putative c-di-GMP-specific phosphodiesterase class I)